MFEHENNNRSIQSWVDEGREAGFPRVVQRNRLSSDTHGVGIGDLEGVVERVGCVGEYICHADCLGA